MKAYVDEDDDEDENEYEEGPIVERSAIGATVPAESPREPIVPSPAVAQPHQTQSISNTVPPLEIADFPGAKAGDTVVHEKFGEGKVLSFENDLVVIDFGNGHTKRFEYPNGFIKGFLKLK